MERMGRLALLEQIAASQQDVFEVELRGTRVVFLNSAPLIREFLLDKTEQFEKSDFQKSVIGKAENQIDRGLGNGLLTSSNAEHAEQEKVIGSAFSTHNIARYADQMAAAAAQLVDGWDVGMELDVCTELMKLSTRIIGETLFSTAFEGSLDELSSGLLKATAQLGRSSRERETQLGETGALQDFSSLVQQSVFQLISERAAGREEAARDVIGLLLQAFHESKANPAEKSAYSPTFEQVVDDVITLLVAGSENPKNALSWTLYLLGSHPAVYERLRDEVARVLQGRLPTYADLRSLPYCLAVYKESLRLYPPGYAFGRRAVADCQLGETAITVGTEVVVSPFALHRRPDYFPEPERFLPERFLPGSDKALQKGAFLPFGAGPRMCIGAQYSLVEGQIVLATLIQRRQLELSPVDQKIYPEPRITLRPAPSVRMKVVA